MIWVQTDFWPFIACKIKIVIPISEFKKITKASNIMPGQNMNSTNGATLRKQSSDSVQ